MEVRRRLVVVHGDAAARGACGSDAAVRGDLRRDRRKSRPFSRDAHRARGNRSGASSLGSRARTGNLAQAQGANAGERRSSSEAVRLRNLYGRGRWTAEISRPQSDRQLAAITSPNFSHVEKRPTTAYLFSSRFRETRRLLVDGNLRASLNLLEKGVENCGLKQRSDVGRRSAG